MEFCIFPLTNSGLYLFDQGTGVLIDGLYGPGPRGDFSPFPPGLYAQMRRGDGLFAHLNALLFTHGHGDHCDRELLAHLHGIKPWMPVYGYGLPGNTWDANILGNGIQRLTVGDFTLVLLDAAHQWDEREQDYELFHLPHCMVIIQCGGQRLLLTADANLSPKEAELVNQFGAFDLVFCNPIQLALEEKQGFFQRLKIKRILITHLPAPQDDRYYLWMQARQLCHKAIGDITPEIAQQLVWLDGNVPEWASSATTP